MNSTLHLLHPGSGYHWQTANSSPLQPGCNLTTPPGELLVSEHSQVFVLLIIGHIINTHNHAIHVSSVTLTKTGSASALELAKDDHELNEYNQQKYVYMAYTSIMCHAQKENVIYTYAGKSKSYIVPHNYNGELPNAVQQLIASFISFIQAVVSLANCQFITPPTSSQ